MRIVFQLVSWLALAATALPSAMYLGGGLDRNRVNMIMLVATVVWFVCTPVWMGRAPVTESDNHAFPSAT